MHEPRNFIGMGFHDYLVGSIGINNAYDGAVGVDDVGVDIGTNVIEPQLLSGAFESRRSGIIDIVFKERKTFCVEDAFGFFSWR